MFPYLYFPSYFGSFLKTVFIEVKYKYVQVTLLTRNQRCDEAEENGNVNLTLSVAPDDMGMVIGKHGKIAKAIRTVMKAAAGTCGKKVNVEIK